MHHNLSNPPGDGSDGSPPSEAWLFAQAILGKPLPTIISPEAKARTDREELARLAQFSTRHSEQLRALRSAEATWPGVFERRAGRQARLGRTGPYRGRCMGSLE
jgi:hypothetical protein